MAENEFPKIFKCPHCGSSKTVIGVSLAPFKENGKIPIDAFGAMERKATPLLDPRMCTLTVPLTMTSWDVCYDCGTYYCTKAEIIQQPKQNAPGAPGIIRPNF